MKKGSQFKAVIKQERQKYIPKKVLRHENFHVSDRYSFRASVWIADTPESHLKPTVNLTLQHNGDALRFCFNNVLELLGAIEQLREWLGGMCVMLNDRHNTALAEYLAFHEGEQLPPLTNILFIQSYKTLRAGKGQDMNVLTEKREKFNHREEGSNCLTEQIQDTVLLISQELYEAAYEKFADGQLSQSEFHELNELLRCWTHDGVRLFTIFRSEFTR